MNTGGFCTKIGGLEFFLKFKVRIARALSSDTSLELTVLILKKSSYKFYIF